MPSMPKKVMILAGEVSGDLHAASLIQELKTLQRETFFFGMGGPRMAEAGVVLDQDITQIAVVGFAEVLKKLPTFWKLFQTLLQKAKTERPDVVILVDNPGFNLRFAKAVRPFTQKIIYYISPQIWAWNSRRIYLIKRLVDKMIVIFPFEEKLYREAGVNVTFVGHPLLDRIKPTQHRTTLLKGVPNDRRLIGILPGSREKEVERHLPILIEASEILSQKIQNLHFLIFKSPALPASLYLPSMKGRVPRTLIDKDPEYEYRNLIEFALVASGTATLETAILEKPMVIVYKTSFLTYLLARNLIRIPYIGMVNVVAGKKIVPECLQFEAIPQKIAQETENYLRDPGKMAGIQEELRRVKQSLGSPGASSRAAQEILHVLSET